MNHWLMRLRSAFRRLACDDGQDLVEYALVVALIAFSATAGMRNVASSINQAFSNVGTKLTTTV